MKKGLSDERLVKRVFKLNRMGGLSERGLGFYLLEFHRRGLYRRYGFSSTHQFALIKLQIVPRKTRELLRVARALEELPAMDRSFSEGRISWSAVRELSRVAVKETEREWLDLAENSSLRKIERTVSRVDPGERPPKDTYSLSKVHYTLQARFDLAEWEEVQAAWARLRGTAGEDLDASSMFLFLVRNFLQQPLSGEEKESRKAYQVIYHLCSECGRAWVETDDGPEGVSPVKVKEREKDAEVIFLEGDREGDREGDGNGEMAVRKPVAADPAAAGPCDPRGTKFHDTAPGVDLPNSPKLRREVLGRDGGICVVPGCSNKGILFAHHVVWRSKGGRTKLKNEICLCQSCHSLIHEGLLRVEGEAPHGLVFRDGQGNPLWKGRDVMKTAL